MNKHIVEIQDIIKNALAEDIGSGDITSCSIVPESETAKAVFLAKEPCIVCGIQVAALVFKIIDPDIIFKTQAKDSDAIKKGEIIASVSGKARSILAGERVALNFLSHLSGIATKTHAFATMVKAYRTKILDTRKTTPGLRLLEKYAVRMGGGYNHRFSLDEMILIKDNHIRIAGGLDKVKALPANYKTEIEVKNLEEFASALRLKPDIIMLDNMSYKDMKEAVKLRNSLSPQKINPLPKLEASGGVSLKNVKKMASTGIDMISIGSLTHSVEGIDISLEFS